MKKTSVLGIIIKILVVFFQLFLILGLSAVLIFVPNKHHKHAAKGDNSRTIMLYIDGSNLESNSKIVTADLNSIDPDKVDLEHVNVLIYTGGTSKWHNFISNQENAIYELTEDGFKKVKTYSKKDMGSANTLLEFLNYSYDNYQTDHYDLIFYNHGGAIDGAVYDDFTKGHLELDEFASALNKSAFDKHNKLELVIFRTCLNATLEVANSFKDNAEYVVSSEEVTYGSSKSSVLNFINNITVDDDAVDIGKKFIDSYKKQMKTIDPYGKYVTTYSIVDLSKIDDINKELNSFVSKIDVDKNYSDISRVRSFAFQYAYSVGGADDYDMIDLYSFVKNVGSYVDSSNTKLLKAIKSAIVYNYSTNSESNGISIYLPYRASDKSKQYLLKALKSVKELDKYYDFANKFYKYGSNNRSNYYSNSLIDATISGSNEFAIQLNDNQAKDFAYANYTIFKKNEDGTFNPVYIYLDPITMNDTHAIKTKIDNNLIAITDEENSTYYLSVISMNGVKQSVIIAGNYSSEDFKDSKFSNAVAYYDESGSEVKISKIINTTKDGDYSFSGAEIGMEEISTIDFLYPHYNILDENGNYTENWETSKTSHLIEVHPGEYKLKKTSLNNSDEFYVVYKIYDVYGNYHYSNLVKID